MLRYYKILLFIGIGTVILHMLWTCFEWKWSNERIKKNPSVKYVLIWTSPFTEPFSSFLEGQETFYLRNCSVRNCYVTARRDLLHDVGNFDVLLFHGKEIFEGMKFPAKRSQKQIYIFASMESSHYYSAPSKFFNNFFNVTWSYKLNSDLWYGYLIIRNKKGEVIGPATDIEWLTVDEMLPINNQTKHKLKDKNKLGAWFVSNCYSKSERETIMQDLLMELRDFSLQVDVYGGCGNKVCQRYKMKDCLKLIQKDYYFYFSLENSISEDYVTEKLLHALNNYAVPVVYGGANYSRFMPKGIYLDASQLSTRELAFEMVKLMSNTDKYYDYFRWHNHYSYHDIEESPETDPYCNFCAYINSLNETKIVENFVWWWNH